MSDIEENSKLDVFDKTGVKVGETYDFNPITVETDKACAEMLRKVRSHLSDPEDIALIDMCLIVVEAKLDEETDFGPSEIIEMYELASRHVDFKNEIAACTAHITQSLDFEIDSGVGDVKDIMTRILDLALKAHSALGDTFEAAVKDSTPGAVRDDSDSDEDDDEDETLTDEDLLPDSVKVPADLCQGCECNGACEKP